jgi:hypothetical protein
MDMNHEKLIQEFAREFALENLPEDKRQALAEKMAETLLQHLFVETMEKLGDAGVAEYEKLLEGEASPEQMEAFFESRIPGYNVFIRETAERFRADLKASLTD